MKRKPQKVRGKFATLAIKIGKMLAYGIVGAFIMIVIVAIVILNDKPDLSPWHTADLDEEYTKSSDITTFAEYLELEDRLFEQLQTEVYEKIEEKDKTFLNRYSTGSLSDPGRWPTNWNRSYELKADSPKAGILLIHGLTDSPYSLRHIGKSLHEAGTHVLALRVPGHGTAPASLARTTWEDMAGAVELAMRHLSEQVGGKPLYVVGYSNGGALAVHYALNSLESSELPSLSGMALLSPEIGITKLAAISIWQQRIGWLLGLEKLKWQSTNVEYDPFKYVSFPVSAGNLAYEITGVNREKIAKLAEDEKLHKFPPLIAFQSSVDATVTATALVNDLFAHLPANRHELVAFDIDRLKDIEFLLKHDPAKDLDQILNIPNRSFTFSLLTNASKTSRETVVRSWPPEVTQPINTPTPYQWPDDVYSLSHLALPMPPDDPLYGGHPKTPSPGIQIGAAVMRGERGAISISATDILRLRWNPFYPYLKDRILEHFKLPPQPDPLSIPPTEK